MVQKSRQVFIAPRLIKVLRVHLVSSGEWKYRVQDPVGMGESIFILEISMGELILDSLYKCLSLYMPDFFKSSYLFKFISGSLYYSSFFLSSCTKGVSSIISDLETSSFVFSSSSESIEIYILLCLIYNELACFLIFITMSSPISLII